MDTAASKGASLLLFGVGGHGRVLLEMALPDFDRIFLADSGAPTSIPQDPKCSFVGTEEDVVSSWSEISATGIHLAIGNNEYRMRLAKYFAPLNVPFLPLFHERSCISPSAEVGAGTSVMAGAVVNVAVRIGAHGIVNTGCIIEHDCTLGNYVRCDPGAILCSGCKVGDGAVIGAGAVLNRGTVVEAGQVVQAAGHIRCDPS